MAGILPYEADVHDDQLFAEDQEAVDAVREIKACLAVGETSKALAACDRMLSLHPGNRLFEGLRLEVENKEREVRLEFIRRLCSELETVADLDARINLIQQALNRYPTESQLLQLLKNATAKRDILQALLGEARNEELSDSYTGSLKRWYLIRELYPTMPGLQTQIHRVESLADSQRKMKRRAEFVDAIFRLSSTGDYTRAVYQCINALAEYPNDGGLLTLKKSIEEKAQHATELQKFIHEGLTFLQSHEADAALEAFAKARTLDQSNLQVRYLIGIALLEKARAVMYNDRRKLSVLLDEAKNFIPDQPELQALSFDSDALPDENWENALVRIEHPGAVLQQNAAEPSPAPPAVEPVVQESAPAADSALIKDAAPASARQPAFVRKLAFVGLAILGALSLVWLVYSVAAQRPSSKGFASNPTPANVDIKTTPAGAEIFVDGRKIGESQVQAQITSGAHTLSASLVGYEPRTVPVQVGSDTKKLQIDLRPILLDLHIVTDQPGGPVWIDNQIRGDITENEITISGIEPGIRTIRVRTPASDVDMSFEFAPGKRPTPKSFPSRQIATVLFVGSAGENLHVECNCAPFGLKVGDLAKLIREAGLDLPLVEGRRPAELWVGKNYKKLTIQGSRSPVATIAVFPSFESKISASTNN